MFDYSSIFVYETDAKESRITVVGDMHLHYSTPKSRIDSYPDTCLEKLRLVRAHMKAVKSRILIILGDVFHTPRQPVAFLNEVIKEFTIFKEEGIDIYAVVGNHDEVNDRLDSIERTALGTLCITGMIHPISRLAHITNNSNKNINITNGNNTTINIIGNHYPNNIISIHNYNNRMEKSNKSKGDNNHISIRYMSNASNKHKDSTLAEGSNNIEGTIDKGVNSILVKSSDYNICVAHKYFEFDLSPAESLWSRDLDKLGYNAYLLGHDHVPYEDKTLIDSELGEVKIIRPGSLTRGTKHGYQLNREVYIVDIVIDGSVRYERRALAVRPASEVFKSEAVDTVSVSTLSKGIKTRLNSLVSKIYSRDGAKIDVYEILDGSEETVDREVKARIENYLVARGIMRQGR